MRGIARTYDRSDPVYRYLSLIHIFTLTPFMIAATFLALGIVAGWLILLSAAALMVRRGRIHEVGQ